MTKFLLRRLAFATVVLGGVTVFIFILSRVAGDPRFLYVGEATTKEQWDEMGRVMGLDRPLAVQYVSWLGKAVRGDLGTSLRDRRPALAVLWERAPATAQLALSAIIFTLMVGVPLGVLSAVKRGSPWDYMGRTFALIGQASPGYWLGIIFILIFAVQLHWLPSFGRGGISHFVLPTITLGWYPTAGLLRLIRSAMLQILDAEYLKFARAKGVNNTLIIWKHAFKNALIAPLTYASLLFAGMITGAVVTETVFSWPGVGRLGVSAVMYNDFPVIVAVVLFSTLAYVTANLTTDILYGYIDPRIRIT